jgi:hypothetical protein
MIMSDSPNYELLKDAYAIIGGIPQEAINLDWSRSKEGLSLTDGTVFHPARWLALHPSFQERGLSVSENGKQILYQGQTFAGGAYSESLAQLFGLSPGDVISLFAERGTRMGEANLEDTDKALWLRRVLSYLQSHGQLAQPAAV